MEGKIKQLRSNVCKNKPVVIFHSKFDPSYTGFEFGFGLFNDTLSQ